MFDSESFGVPSSQPIPSSQSSCYVPSSGSSKCQDSETLDDSIADGKAELSQHIINPCFQESEDLSGAIVLVMWTSLLQLLCKCRKPGCAAAVLPDNMKPVRNGQYNFEFKLFWFLWLLLAHLQSFIYCF